MKHILSIITVFVLAGCSLPNTTVDSSAPPFISLATASLTIIDVGQLPAAVDTIIVVTAAAQGKNVTTVSALITVPDGSSLSYALSDAGTGPDKRAGDGIYTGNVPLHLTAAAVGKYVIQVQASGDEGLVSNIVALPVSVISSNNRPPVISGLIAPDTVLVPAAGSSANLIKVSVAVADPDGLGSIESVSFTSYRPDGTVAGVYAMLDDGGVTNTGGGVTSGDDAAGDGRYTLTLQLPSGTTGNTYRDFVFSAKDKSGAISNTLTKRVYIK